MSNMTLSPLQQDYVTKTEFKDFRDQVNDRFDKIDVQFEQIDAKFDKIDARFERIDCQFSEIDKKFVNCKDEIINTLKDEFARQTGIILETFQHNLKASMEYMDSKLDKKLDKSEFYEYMELHFPKQTKMPSKKAKKK
jgi:predicted transcriptional regulator